MRTPDVDARKHALRLELRAARASRGSVPGLHAHLLAALAPCRGGTVAAYVPVGTEPSFGPLLADLRAAGVQVLLPVVVGRARAGVALDWAVFEGALVDAAFGLREPPGPRLGPAALAEAAQVLVPALAVDRRGVRLGQGGGFYDASLAFADPAAPLIAVVDDAELVTALPVQPHDRRVTHVVTPRRGLRPVGVDHGAPGS